MVCFSGFCLGCGFMAGEAEGLMSHVITKQWRHKILVLNVFQHRSNVLLAVLLLPCKVAKSLFPETSLLVAIQLAHLNHLFVLLILHVVMHDLLETMGERLISCKNPPRPLTFCRDLRFSPSHVIPRLTQKPNTSLFFTLYNCLASTVRYFCRAIIYHAHLEVTTINGTDIYGSEIGVVGAGGEAQDSRVTSKDKSNNSQFALLIEVENTILEIVHLT